MKGGFIVDIKDNGYYDEVGGFHEGGCGTSPSGEFCGECSKQSCKDCVVWKKEQEQEG